MALFRKEVHTYRDRIDRERENMMYMETLIVRYHYIQADLRNVPSSNIVRNTIHVCMYVCDT